MYNLILFIQGVENLSWEQIYDMLDVLHLSTSSGSFLCLYRSVNIFVYMGKYLLKMYITLVDILGLLLLVGRLNKSCQMFSTLACFFILLTCLCLQ